MERFPDQGRLPFAFRAFWVDAQQVWGEVGHAVDAPGLSEGEHKKREKEKEKKKGGG
jgi:hypothetical protein